MTTFNTGNPIGSTDARDRLDNSENLDLAVNSLSPTFVDRLGVTRDTLEGIYQKSAYYRAGTFDAGYTLTNNRQTLAYGNVEYSWSGAFPKVVAAGSTPATSGGVGAGAWVDRTDVTLRSELIGARGDSNVTHTQYDSNINRTVTEKLNKYSSCEDYGATKTEYGYNPTVDALVVSDSEQDEDFLLPRHIGVAKDLYGVRRNASVISARANSGADGFNTQVTGVNTTQDLADYGSVDNVTAFFDCTSKPYETWEVITNPIYSATGFSATGYDFTKLKKGMVLRTDHATPYFGLVREVNGQSVTISEWRKKGSTTGEIPEAGIGLHINPVDKLWALNCNIILAPDTRSDNCAIAEFGLVNNTTPNPRSLNCFDMVILPGSTYGATSGFFVHSSSLASSKFDACYRARNSNSVGAGFFADKDNYRGFWAIDSQHGFVYSSSTHNGYSYMVKKTNESNNGDFWMGIDANGRVTRMPDRTRAITQSGTLDTFYRRAINGSNHAITTALPSEGLQDGDLIILHCAAPASGLWTITAASILPPGGLTPVTSAILTEGVYDAVYIGGVWYINK